MHVLHLGEQETEVLGMPALLAATRHPLVVRHVQRGFCENRRDILSPLRFDDFQVRPIESSPHFVVEIIRRKHFPGKAPLAVARNALIRCSVASIQLPSKTLIR